MSSKKANDIHFGGLKDYRAAEGREVLVQYQSSVANTIQELLGGLRSACTYVAQNLKNLPKCATMIRVSNQFNSIFLRVIMHIQFEKIRFRNFLSLVIRSEINLKISSQL